MKLKVIYQFNIAVCRLQKMKTSFLSTFESNGNVDIKIACEYLTLIRFVT